jgi:hypothetical protein
MTLPNLSPIEVAAGASGLESENAAVAPISGASFGSGYQSPALAPIAEGPVQKGFPAVGERRFRSVGPARLRPHPSLRLAKEGTNLVEQVMCGHAELLEPLDSLQSSEHCAGLVHWVTVAAPQIRIRGPFGTRV